MAQPRRFTITVTEGTYAALMRRAQANKRSVASEAADQLARLVTSSVARCERPSLTECPLRCTAYDAQNRPVAAICSQCQREFDIRTDLPLGNAARY